ncbi:MAG: hypothetical protein GY820_20425 [Gammaproteobacteria bacterium]|nr:hypothetical protein [Gammaproteobacteria bacterium]
MGLSHFRLDNAEQIKQPHQPCCTKLMKEKLALTENSGSAAFKANVVKEKGSSEYWYEKISKTTNDVINAVREPVSNFFKPLARDHSHMIMNQENQPIFSQYDVVSNETEEASSNENLNKKPCDSIVMHTREIQYREEQEFITRGANI